MMFVVYSKKGNHTRASYVFENRREVKAEIRRLRKQFPECIIMVAEVTRIWDVDQQGEWQSLSLET